jgi:hypothetical protein
VIGYIQDYLVNRFLKSVKASRVVVLAVNTLLSFDALSAVRLILSFYGMTNFANALFLLTMFM